MIANPMARKLDVIDTGNKSSTGFAGKKVFLNGFGYNFNTKWNTIDAGMRIRWICEQNSVKGCTASVLTDINYNVLKSSDSHCHESLNVHRINAIKAISTMKTNAQVFFTLKL